MTTNWILKHVAISVPISSNFVGEPIFFCKFDVQHLAASFIGCLKCLALQRKTQLKYSVCGHRDNNEE